MKKQVKHLLQILAYLLYIFLFLCAGLFCLLNDEPSIVLDYSIAIYAISVLLRIATLTFALIKLPRSSLPLMAPALIMALIWLPILILEPTLLRIFEFSSNILMVIVAFSWRAKTKEGREDEAPDWLRDSRATRQSDDSADNDSES